MSKKTTFLLILSILLLLFASCDSEVPTVVPTDVPTEAPTVAPTVEQTEAPTVAPTNAPTDMPTDVPTVAPTEAPTSAPTEVQTDEPTEAPTIAPTEACTHEWKNVSIEECTHCGETQPHTDKNGEKYVRYQLSGFCTVTRFSDEEVRECTDRVLLDILNRQDWQIYHGYEFSLWSERAYSLTFGDNVRFYYNCAEGYHRGQIVNYADGRWAQLSDEDADTLNRMLTALFPDSLATQTIDRIELVYCGYGDRAYMIEDEEEIERLSAFLFEAKAKQVGESTCGYAGVSYSLDFYSGEKCVFDLDLWGEGAYSTCMHKDLKGYAYFYYGDFSELYNYLSENYPHEFWFPES